MMRAYGQAEPIQPDKFRRTAREAEAGRQKLMVTLIASLIGTLGLLGGLVIWWAVTAPDRRFRQSARSKRRYRRRNRAN